jgi:hypothetical protein
VRAGLLNAWPGLSHYYGIHPWDVERLSYLELQAYVDDLNEVARAQQRAQSEARRRGR